MEKKDNIKEDSAFGSGMMFGIPGPGPKRDTKGIPSDPKMEKGKEIGKTKIKKLNMHENRAFTSREIRKDAMDLAKSLGITNKEDIIQDLINKIKEVITKYRVGVIFEDDMSYNKNKTEDLKTFEEFISENQIFEAQFGNDKVVIFPGRFQPFHNGHIAALKKAHDIFRLPVVPVQILSKTDKSPFDDGLLMKIGQAVANEFDWMAGYSLYPPGAKTVVPQMIKYLREQFNYEPVGMGCGSDRLKAYEPQVKYLNSDRTDVPVSEPFRLEVCDERAPGGPSGTKVREAIIAGDVKLFEELTPKSVHKFYKDLKKSLS